MRSVNYAINLLSAVTLGGAYDGGRASPISRDLLQRAVGLQRPWRGLFLRKAEVAIIMLVPVHVRWCLNRKLQVAKGKNSATALHLAAGSLVSVTDMVATSGG